MDLLVLCTANICRSPMAEGLLRHHVDTKGKSALVHSAGFMFDGRRADGYATEAVGDRGIDISDHRSRIVTPAMLGEADVVLTMTREHVRDAALKLPEAFPKIFPIREFVRRSAEVGPRGERDVKEWLAEVAEGRTPRTYLLDVHADKIDDPIGGSPAEFRSCAELLNTLLEQVVTSAL